MSKRTKMQEVITGKYPGYWMDEGCQLFTNGYYVVSLSGSSIDTEGFKEREALDCDKFFAAARDAAAVTMPCPGVKELRNIAKEKEVWQPRETIWWHCNPLLLAEIVEIIKVRGNDVELHVPFNRKESGMISCGENVAVLLPINKKTADEQRKYEEELERQRAEREEYERMCRESERRRREEKIANAESAIINKKKFNDEPFEGTTLVLFLLDKYGLKVPARVAGWIKTSLRGIGFDEDGEIQYWRKIGSCNSRTFPALLIELEKRINDKLATEAAEALPFN